jgi:hypothetical protein
VTIRHPTGWHARAPDCDRRSDWPTIAAIPVYDEHPRSDSPESGGSPDPPQGSTLDALPGIVRIAAHSGLRAATWGAAESVKTGVGLARRLPFGGLAVRAVEEAAEHARRSARQLLGVEDVERRLSRLVPERVSETSRAWGAAVGHGAPAQSTPQLGAAEVLQRRGSDLLHQAADVTFDQQVHPAYARILDELAPDEARILRLMVTRGPQPSVDVRTGRPLRIGDTLIASGLTVIGPESGCRHVERVPSYLNNLFRLGLIWFSQEELPDLRGYQVLEAQPEVKDAMRRAGRAARLVRRSIALTPFGRDFCAVCLPLGTPPS